jgi:PAS domain S-box-containing protein
MYFLHVNYHRLTVSKDLVGIPIVMFAVGFRWVVGMVTYGIARYLGLAIFSAFVLFELTAAVLVGEILMGYAILKHHLFRVRGVVTQVALVGAIGVAGVTLVVLLVDFVFQRASAGVAPRLFVVLAGIVPLALAGPWLWQPLERQVLCWLDPRRAKRRGVLERALESTRREVDPEAVLARTIEALGEVTVGGRVAFLRGGGHPSPGGEAPPPALAGALATSDVPHLHRAQADAFSPEAAQDMARLGVDLCVPVRRAGKLYGVLTVEGGVLDRDTALTAVTLAEHLALKLENLELFAEMIRTSRSLGSTTALLEQLFESLPIGVAALDNEDRVLRWNRALEIGTGIKSDDAVGKRYFDDLFPGLLDSGVRDRVDTLSSGTTRSVERLGIEYELPGRRGPGYFDAIAAPFRDHDGKCAGVVVITQDVTERRRLENELEDARRLASLGAFAAAIAHEIRNPLTSIQMNVQILKNKVALPPADMEYFDITLEELKRLNAEVAEILDFAKPVQLQVVPTDLREVADDAARGMEPILAGRRLTVERRHPESLPPALADAQRIRQVLVNLLDNAGNASPEGAEIVVQTRTEPDGRAVLEVVDKGRGIREEDLPKIFEPFFTTRADGTGLGLAIAQKIVKAHGGEIRVESKVGAGATFAIVLPTARAA